MSEENKMKEMQEGFEAERREYNELLNLLVNIQKDYTRSNKMKDIIIIALIISILLEACAFYGGFLWWESKYSYSDTETTTVEMISEGDEASAEYNDVDYHDNSVHNEN